MTRSSLNEVLTHMVELMMDPFGNYLCQKVIDMCSPNQLQARPPAFLSALRPSLGEGKMNEPSQRHERGKRARVQQPGRKLLASWPRPPSRLASGSGPTPTRIAGVVARPPSRRPAIAI